jgi:tRNA(Ile)-lysidine synthase
VRPLLAVTREETRAYCRSRGLIWREDESNEDPRFARARVRGEILPALRTLSPAAEHTIGETARLLREEAAVLDGVVAEALKSLGGGPVVELAALAGLPPAVTRLALRSLAEEAFGAEFSLSAAQVDAVLRLGEGGGSASLDVGDGLRAVVEYGTLRFRRGGDAPAPAPVELGVPGTARFGGWEVEASVGPPSAEAWLDPGAAQGPLVIRSWQDGDRMRPVGVGGTKSLQDLFTDRKVPRALRRSLPVVCAGEEIAWVAGVALDERFAATDEGAGAIGLSARRV